MVTPILSFLDRIRAVPVVIWIILLNIFLVVNVAGIYLEFADQVRPVLNLYIILLVAGLALTGGVVAFKRQPKWKFNFPAQLLIGFMLTAVIMWLMVTVPQLQGAFAITASLEAVQLAFAFALLHGGVKAFTEEFLFRYVLPEKLNIPDIMSALLFGLFHFSVLYLRFGFGIESLMGFGLLTGLGIIWYKMRDYFGFWSSVGSHYAYNLIVLGVI